MGECMGRGRGHLMHGRMGGNTAFEECTGILCAMCANDPAPCFPAGLRVWSVRVCLFPLGRPCANTQDLSPHSCQLDECPAGGLDLADGYGAVGNGGDDGSDDDSAGPDAAGGGWDDIDPGSDLDLDAFADELLRGDEDNGGGGDGRSASVSAKEEGEGGIKDGDRRGVKRRRLPEVPSECPSLPPVSREASLSTLPPPSPEDRASPGGGGRAGGDGGRESGGGQGCRGIGLWVPIGD